MQICYRCHVPQLNDELHGTFTGTGKECKFKDVIAPVIFGVYEAGDLRVEASTAFGQGFTSRQVYLNWLLGEPVRGHRSNLVGVFLWFANRWTAEEGERKGKGALG